MTQTNKINTHSNQISLLQQSTTNVEPLVSESRDFRYGFKLGDLGFLIPKTVLSEVISNPNIYPIPNTTTWMKGLISVRGNFATVFDLNDIFELQLVGNPASVMVLQIDSDYIAFPIDSAHSLELPEIATEETFTIATTIRPFLDKAYKIDQSFWFEFDFKRCISQFVSQIHP